MSISALFLAVTAAIALAPALRAHIGWSGTRNFDTLANGITETSTDRTVSGSFGWADGTDANQGDSHRLTYFRFVVGETTSVSISVSRDDLVGQSGATGVFLPAFSLYRIDGTMPASTHDGSTHTVNYLTSLFGAGAAAESYVDTNTNNAWDAGESFTDTNANGVWDSAGVGGSGKEGSFNALADWRIYNDSGAAGQFVYVGHAADGSASNYGLVGGIHGDGLADGSVTWTFADLVAGEYFIAVGGARYLGQNTETGTFPSYGVEVSVTAIPEPSAFAAAAGLGALALASLRRRRIA